MSRRIFLQLREKYGLAYDVYSYTTNFLDTGSFVISAAVDPKKVIESIDIVISELVALRDNVISQDELIKAKEITKGRLMLRLEDSRSVSSWVGVQQMLSDAIRSPEQVIAEIDSVKVTDITSACNHIIDDKKMCMAIVGPFRNPGQFTKLVKL